MQNNNNNNNKIVISNQFNLAFFRLQSQWKKSSKTER